MLFRSEVFDGYEKEDVEGLLSDRLKKGKERLDDALESIKALIEPVAAPKDQTAFRKYFCGNTENPDELKDNEQKRIALYKQTIALVRSYANIANEMEEAGYTAKEIEQIKIDVKYFENLRAEIKLASGDYIDLKVYEPAMRHLIDTYISAEESEKISAFDDLTLVQLIVERGEDAIDSLPNSIKKNKEAVAETIENNIRRLIIDETPTNPIYFEKMSVLLDELIKARKQEAINYKKYLEKIVELTRRITKPETSSSYPKTLNSKAKRALFDNLNRDEKLAIDIDAAIIKTKKDDWRGNKIKKKEIRNAIKKFITDPTEVERVFDLAFNQKTDY